MEDLTQEWTQLGPFFPKSGHFFRLSKKGQGRPPPHSSLPLVVRLGCNSYETYTEVSDTVCRFYYKEVSSCHKNDWWHQYFNSNISILYLKLVPNLNQFLNFDSLTKIFGDP